jgi:hypothetical protein
MNYSRRQLEALGEPLGEDVTRAKPGGRIYGGGGSAPSSPTNVTQTNLTYPQEFQPMVKEMAQRSLAQASSPYVAYGGQRLAGFDPLQLTAQQAVANITPSQQLGPATQFASSAGMKAGDIQYTPMGVQTQSFLQPGMAQAYMSPYTQNVVDIQAREARRQSEIERNRSQAQAVGQGAFGGSRQAIVEAERQRNLGQQLGDIQQRGQQAAFEQAQNLFGNEQQRALQAAQQTEASRQFGAGLGLQGLQAQLQAANQLAGIGGQQFQQQADIINALSAAGQQRQALEQQRLSQDYQDFLTQKQFPYQQLAFMGEMLKGVPQQTTQQIYQAPPSLVSQLGGLGLAAYGLFGRGKAEGGKVAEDEYEERPAGLGELALRNAQMKARA